MDYRIEDVELELSKKAAEDARLMMQLEANYVLTILYVIVEVTRNERVTNINPPVRPILGKLLVNLNFPTQILMSFNPASTEPNLLILLTQIISKMRWEEEGRPSCIPRQKVCLNLCNSSSINDEENKVILLFWKIVLLHFGSCHDVEECQQILRKESGEPQDDSRDTLLTASPLDYHLFRQEITSKYPAYSPPQPLIPVEPENNSILPPLSGHPSRQTSHDNLSALTSGNPVNQSIFNQPVHIATPAPSPPPSPAGPGGKGGKKQNYQTNQNFPFLYPPLDEYSNTLGGKGSADRQDKLVGKRWEGGDVPASISEAGQLFASRMRMSRSLRQLWDVRERYIKEERGWGESNVAAPARPSRQDDEDEDDENSLIEESILAGGLEESSSSAESSQGDENVKGLRGAVPAALKSQRETSDKVVQSRLDAVEYYYVSYQLLLPTEFDAHCIQREALPDLQSLVVTLFKDVSQHVLAHAAVGGVNGLANGLDDSGPDSGGKRKTNPNSSASLNQMLNGHSFDLEDGNDPAVEGLNETRSREISSKAVSGVLLLLLKWFRVSRESWNIRTCISVWSTDRFPKTSSSSNTLHNCFSTRIGSL